MDPKQYYRHMCSMIVSLVDSGHAVKHVNFQSGDITIQAGAEVKHEPTAQPKRTIGFRVEIVPTYDPDPEIPHWE